MSALLAILAGGAGAVARYALSGLVQARIRSTRPWGTAVVNLSGALALGVVAGLHNGAVLSESAFDAAGVGFLGGFTTFSTWMVESVSLFETGGGTGVRTGLANVIGQLALGVAGAGLGLAVGHQF